MTSLNRLRNDRTSLSEKLAARIFALAKEYYALMSDIDAEHLSYDDYTNLLEYEAKLNAYGNLLLVRDVRKFLHDELKDARCYLRCTRLRLKASRTTGEDGDGGAD
jgi:hypothetical protein